MKTSDEAIREISTYLLKGYTLLQQSCPQEGCLIPLIRKGKDGDMLCLRCGNVYRYVWDEDSGEMQFGMLAPAPASGQSSTSVSASAPSSASASASASTATVSEPPKPAATSSVGPSSAHPESDAAMEHDGGDGDDDEPEYEYNYKPLFNTDEVSAEIGQKLLRRWVLLAESCAKCSAPLLQTPQGDFYCPGCKKMINEPEPTPTPVVEVAETAPNSVAHTPSSSGPGPESSSTGKDVPKHQSTGHDSSQPLSTPPLNKRVCYGIGNDDCGDIQMAGSDHRGMDLTDCEVKVVKSVRESIFKQMYVASMGLNSAASPVAAAENLELIDKCFSFLKSNMEFLNLGKA